MLFLGVLSSLLLATAPVPATQPAAREKFTIKPTQIMETRYKIYENSDLGISIDARSLSVDLQIHGPALINARRYGHLKIEEAVDDTGADLRPTGESMFDRPKGEWEAVSPAFPSGLGAMLLETVRARGCTISIRLTSSARKATRIRTLRGEVQILAQGNTTSVSLPHVPDLIGRKIEDGTLKAAGVDLLLHKPGEKAAEDSPYTVRENDLVIEPSGRRWAIEEIAILDENGQRVGEIEETFEMDEKQSRVMRMKRPLDDTMRLKVKLLAGQKTITVPFDLRDIELP